MRRFLLLPAAAIAVNIVLVFVLFLFAEVALRVYREGFREGTQQLWHSLRGVPYSNLGTGNWVIKDDALGYRLNPQRPGINHLSVRHTEISVPKPHDLYRVVVLGDSIPWDTPGFVTYIRDMLAGHDHFEIINAGIPGYTTYQEVLFFEQSLSQTDPDLVILTYCLNDNHKFLHRFDEKAHMLWTQEAMESLEAQSFVDKLVGRSYILSEIKVRFIATTAQRRARTCDFPWQCTYDFHIAWLDEPWDAFERHIRTLKSRVEGKNGRLAIVVFPYEPQLDEAALAKNAAYVLKPQSRVNDVCARQSLPCLDLFPLFRQRHAEKLKLFRDGIHLTEAGHRLTAKAIYAFLQDKGLLPHLGGTDRGTR